MALLKRILIGQPMETTKLSEEKLPKWKALAVFSSDALSSVAYATEEILLVLSIIGIGTFFYSIPISLTILGLLLIVTISYRHIIFSFPTGGGAYIVAREHIGTKTSLVAGSALMIDYVLTVAVSISSGVAALISAFPSLLYWRVELAVCFIFILMILNLRGIRESATVFAYPTYVFILSVLILLIFGGVHLLTEGWTGYGHNSDQASLESTSTAGLIYILARAFSSGCSAMTGVEAISNGVPSFRPNSSKNAAYTLIWMSILLGTMFLGITFLSAGLGIAPVENKTVISQIASGIFGNGIVFFFFQIVTMLILVLAANTSFAGFPQLVSIIAKDGYLPRSLAARGDRLVFSNGIILLSLLACFLVLIFSGDTHALIPLYAVGVFLSFTIGQYGLVKKLWAEKHRIYEIGVIALGTITTAVVTIITAVAKFTSGAWLIIITIPLLVWVFNNIKEHYIKLGNQLALHQRLETEIPPTRVIVPISGISKTVDQSIVYAKSIATDITAFSVVFSQEQEQIVREHWKKWYPEIKLDVVYSPYRTILDPLLEYLEKPENHPQGTFITILMPQFITRKWWHVLLHNQTAVFLRFYLIWKKDIVVSTLPFHLKE
ncbi:APC family permease [Bacillus marasmi]|uniref:APC family permease n=1 Tax=Bacillus marasmi TaxID=1926279 RepID=UPI0011C86F8E|nr:APC family permease [Bacillus marasmi]